MAALTLKAMSMIQVLRETYEAPADVQNRIERAGGSNLYGEPNFRVVWGGSRLAWVGGRWCDHDVNGNLIRESIELRRVPKYIATNRWHIERWTAPEAYGSPAAWNAQTLEKENGIYVPALGPFPRRGEYEHCFTLEGSSGEFLALSATACDWVVRAIEWSRRQPREIRRRAIETRENRRERNWDASADSILDDAGPAFHGQEFVQVATSPQPYQVSERPWDRL